MLTNARWAKLSAAQNQALLTLPLKIPPTCHQTRLCGARAWPPCMHNVAQHPRVLANGRVPLEFSVR